jgi:hypothetical protein
MQWLTMKSFQQSQQLLAAINTLSIHIKLRLARVKDQEREDEVEKSRSLLGDFLSELEAFVVALGDTGTRPVTGVDARTRQLARSFIQARRDLGHHRSLLFRNSLGQVREMLFSEDPKNQQALLDCLDDLRRLLETHIHTDARKILGEI